MTRSGEPDASGLGREQVVLRAALCFALVVGSKALLHLAQQVPEEVPLHDVVGAAMRQSW